MSAMTALTKYLQQNNMKAADFARLLGVSRAAVSRWESGHRKPAICLLPKIEKLTGIPRRKLRPDLFEAA